MFHLSRVLPTLRACLGFGIALGLAVSANAQSFPSKPIRMLVPSAAGSAPDIIARLVSDKMSRSLGQPIVIDNKPGAGGIISMTQLRQAPADGYTLTLVQGAVAVITPFMYKEASYDVERDCQIIGTVASTPMLFVASTKFAATTLGEAIEAARRAPGEVTLGSSTRGSVPNLANELLASKSGARFQVVPFSTTSQGVQATVGGDVALFTDGAAPLLPLVKAGRLRALALASDTPMPGLENIPLAKHTVPGLNVSGWFVVLGPKGMPKDIISRLNKDLNLAIALPDVTAKLQELGAYPKGGTVETAEEFVKLEKSIFGSIIRETGIKAE